MRKTKSSKLAVTLLSGFLLSGCFSWEHDGTFGVEVSATWWGAPDATVPIFRRPTLRLRQHYRNVMRAPNGVRIPCSQHSWATKARCVQGDLRSAEERMPDLESLRARWRAALADDQLSDLHEAIEDSAPAGKCLTLYARIGAGDIGYNWTTRNDGENRCRRGNDPTPGFLPAID